MAQVYRIIGSEESPYSVKVRAYFRYKNIPHEWMSRAEAGDLFKTHAKLPLVPLVVTPDDRGIQDSTPIIEAMEALHPDPGIHPHDARAAFASTVIEEFGDEWGNKWMFHFRWAREVDQIGCSKRLAAATMPGADDAQIEQAALTIRERMVPRVWFVGSNEVTAPQIEQSFKDMLAILDTHLADRPYLFGARPAFGDFGMWGQIYNARRDHTPKEILRSAPNVEAWIDRMLEPQALGEFEGWSSLAGTLSPLLADQVAGLFLPWSAANAAAIADGRDEFSVTLKGNTWTQKPQKYHARSLAKLKAKYLAASSSDEIRTVLEGTGCLDVLASPG